MHTGTRIRMQFAIGRDLLPVLQCTYVVIEPETQQLSSEKEYRGLVF